MSGKKEEASKGDKWAVRERWLAASRRSWSFGQVHFHKRLLVGGGETWHSFISYVICYIHHLVWDFYSNRMDSETVIWCWPQRCLAASRSLRATKSWAPCRPRGSAAPAASPSRWPWRRTWTRGPWRLAPWGAPGTPLLSSGLKGQQLGCPLF